METAINKNSKPIAVSDETFQQEVVNSSVPVMVDFWAPWCGPCRYLVPSVEELASEYSGRIRVAKVNTDENPQWASMLGIRGIPTVIYFKDGREVGRTVGAMPKEQLKQAVDRAFGFQSGN